MHLEAAGDNEQAARQIDATSVNELAGSLAWAI
jgi:hypothetical protein